MAREKQTWYARLREEGSVYLLRGVLRLRRGRPSQVDLGVWESPPRKVQYSTEATQLTEMIKSEMLYPGNDEI